MASTGMESPALLQGEEAGQVAGWDASGCPQGHLSSLQHQGMRCV